MSIEEIFKNFNSRQLGLEESEAKTLLDKYGYNELPEKKKTSDLELLIEQFKNILVLILVAAAVISFFLGEVLDGIAITFILFINAFLGFYQERKAERALEALKKIAAPKAKVIRDGEAKTIESRNLVPGDVIILEMGDKVPADARIIEQLNLKVDESILTGESLPVEKIYDKIEKDVIVAEMKNMVFSGTTVVYGRCKAIIVSTGQKTEFGKIAKALEEEEEQTPLQKKLEKLGKQLSIIILAVTAIVFISGWVEGLDPVNMFLIAVSLAVAAIPEGLPAIVTITLAIGMVRMSKKNAIIRKLSAAETLGATTVICSDKTGTLTVNQMTVKKIYVPGEIVDVTGEGYSIKGEFLKDGKKIEREDIKLLLAAGLLCNNSQLGKEAVGDPTEIALIVSALKYGLEDIRKNCTKINEISFDSNRKMMSVVCKMSNRNIMYTKGAVEEVLKRCRFIYRKGAKELLTIQERNEILKINSAFASNALRVLAFAYTEDSSEEKDLVFIGLQGMIDPPRKDVKYSINRCQEAGIKVVMITGDHRETAVAIAKELGLLKDEKKQRILTGLELDKLNEKEFSKIVEDVSVYARVSPEHKVRITDVLKKKKHVVAMTGDGINDAPALKKADIGIAMGISGTDVSKEASDMILIDDNFATIVSAVEEGRSIYDNIKKFIYYLLSCNIAEVMVIFIAIMFVRDPMTGMVLLPLVPLQILWMNLITDGLPALALGVEPKEPDVMSRKPRNTQESIINKRSILIMLIISCIITLGTFWVFLTELPNGLIHARTMAFTTIVFFELFVALNFRSEHPLLEVGLFTNKKLLLAILSSILLQLMVIYVPLFDPIFETTFVSLSDWVKIILVSSSIFFILEARKYAKKMMKKSRKSN